MLEGFLSNNEVIAANQGGPEEIMLKNGYGTLYELNNSRDLTNKLSYTCDKLHHKQTENKSSQGSNETYSRIQASLAQEFSIPVFVREIGGIIQNISNT